MRGLYFIAVLAVGCGGGTVSEPKPAEFDTSAMAGKILDALDANKNGSLEQNELGACPALQLAFSSIDKDRNKSISREELVARLEQYKTAVGGTVPVAVHVKLENEPLAGATVTFDPEPWMADVVKPTTGVTDAYGRCAEFSVGDKRFNGMTAGLYKIRVTKDGTEIASRYNTETTLGREIVTDGRAGEIEVTLTVSAR